jgi:hypothetical protein
MRCLFCVQALTDIDIDNGRANPFHRMNDGLGIGIEEMIVRGITVLLIS